MNGLDGFFQELLRHHAADHQIRGRDQIDVDPLFGQGIEHSAGDPALALHSLTNYRDGPHSLVDDNLARADLPGESIQITLDLAEHLRRNEEGDVIVAFMALGLDDEKNIYGVGSENIEHPPGNTGLIGNSKERDLGDIRIVGDTSDQYFFHLAKLLSSLL